MEEVMDILNSMFQNVVSINTGNYSEEIKLESQKIMDDTFDFVIENTAQQTINALVYDEWKKSKSGNLS